MAGENPHAVERIWDKMYRHAIHGRKGTPMMILSLLVATVVFWTFFDYFAAPIHPEGRVLDRPALTAPMH